jgi:hypothetical protein
MRPPTDTLFSLYPEIVVSISFVHIAVLEETNVKPHNLLFRGLFVPERHNDPIENVHGVLF